jgi:predicted O-linked N-acetylglucosamine transferase (SPINDLY family)
MLLAPGSERRRAWVRDSLGVDAERIEFVNRSPRRKYFSFYHPVDIALDTFPFNGHTTTCDALWMGAPVVHLAGETYASRFGGSALANLALPELIANDPQNYVHIAVNLAKDANRLRELRANLRERMRESIITDGPRFTRQLEQTYREIWKDWCGK